MPSTSSQRIIPIGNNNDKFMIKVNTSGINSFVYMIFCIGNADIENNISTFRYNMINFIVVILEELQYNNLKSLL